MMEICTEACTYGEESCEVCASGCVLEAGEVSRRGYQWS